jgi:hypothetical protein
MKIKDKKRSDLFHCNSLEFATYDTNINQDSSNKTWQLSIHNTKPNIKYHSKLELSSLTLKLVIFQVPINAS